MTSPRRASAMIGVLGLTLLLTGCTREDPPAPAASSTAGGGVVSDDAADTAFVPGRFLYRFNSITAQAVFDGNVATVSVRNGTGAELGPPSITVLGADDREYEGTAEGAGPVPDGEQVTLEFTFPEAVSPETIGLVVLTLGDENVGAMPPVPVGGGG